MTTPTASFKMAKDQVRTPASGFPALRQAPKNATDERFCLLWRCLLSYRWRRMRRTGLWDDWLSRRLACVASGLCSRREHVVPIGLILSRSYPKCGVDSRARAPRTMPWGHRTTRPPTPPLGVESPPFTITINFMQTAGLTGCVVHSICSTYLYFYGNSYRHLYPSLQDLPRYAT